MLAKHREVQEKYSHKDINDYRKAAMSFKKQIRMMDSKLQSIDNHQDSEKHLFKEDRFTAGRISQLKQHDDGNNGYILYSNKQVASDILKREKPNATHSLNPQTNMFKNTSSNHLPKKNLGEGLRLPVLEKKSVFQSQSLFDEQSRPKYIKVSVDRLIPLRAQDIKKKFESKYKMNQRHIDHNLR